jgi:zinc transport system substrate-binding protein
VRRVWLLRFLLLVILFGAGWSAGSSLRSSRAAGWTGGSGKLRVLTTIFPLFDFARQVGGDAVEVRNLLPAGVDPHEYALAPSDAELVSHSDILIANGRGLDDFLTEALSKADQAGRQPLQCGEGLPALQADAHDAHDGEQAHDHGEGDPHFWLDPVLARRYARRIASTIVAALREQGKLREAREVERRASDYDASLVRLDEDFRRELAPFAGRPFIAFHGAYGYLAARYDLHMAAVWEPSPGRQPGPRDVARLIDLAGEKKVEVFFAEPGFSSRAVEMIAGDARLRVLTLDPLETALEPEKTNYLDTMGTNLRTLRHAFRPD